MRAASLSTILMLGLACQSSAQDVFAVRFAKQVERDAAVLSSRPTVAAWQRSHRGDKLASAHYQSDQNSYEVDYARVNRWCAVSVNNAASDSSRAAFFYVPSVRAGALPPLPETEDKTLTGTCQMQAIWYETHAETIVGAIVHELSSSWGSPNGTSSKPDVVGSGLWEDVVAWHRARMSIWVAFDRICKEAVRSRMLLPT